MTTPSAIITIPDVRLSRSDAETIRQNLSHLLALLPRIEAMEAQMLNVEDRLPL